MRLGKTGLTREKISLLIIYCVVALLIIVLTYFYLGIQKKAITDELNKNLSTIATMKSAQLTEWYIDELHDAYIISHNEFLIENIEKWFQSGSPDSWGKLNAFLVNIAEEHDYESILIINKKGELLGSSQPDLKQIDSLLVTRSILAITSDSVLSTDLYQCKPHLKRHIDFISPLNFPEISESVAVIFRISPSKFIFPLLNQWPVSSYSAENLLVRDESGTAVFLSPSKHIRDSIYQLIVPPNRFDDPAHKAIIGNTGKVTGTDYRGKKVFAFIEPVRFTPWFILSKIDREEISVEFRNVTLLAIVICLLIVGVTAFGLAFFYSLQQKNHYHDLWQMTEEHKTTLYSIGDGVITTDKSGLIKQMNLIAEKLTGYTENEAKNQVLEKVFKIVNEESGQLVENPVTKVLREGKIVGLANHTLLISKHGERIPIADSGAPIFGEEGQINGVVLVFRNQTEERTRQKALEESRRQLLTLMGNLPGMAYRCKNDVDWTMLFVSEGCYELTGYHSNELINNKLIAFGELIVPEFRNKVDETIQKALQSGTHYLLEYQIKTSSGEIKWVWEQGSGFFDQEGHLNALEGFITDITQKKKAEEEKLRFANVLEASMNELLMFDAHSFCIVYANQGAINNLGYNREELMKLTITDIENDPSFEAYSKMIAPLANGMQETIAFETEHKRKDGSHYPVEVHLQLLEQKEKSLYLVVAIDISERKKSEEALKKSEEEYRNLFENHTAVKLLIDPTNSRIVNANQAAEKFYGYSKEQLLSMKITDIDSLHNDEIKKLMKLAESAQNTHFEVKHCLANKQIRNVEVYLSPVEFQGKTLLHSIIHDVTDKKEAERKIQLLSRSIEQSPVCVIITNLQGEIEYVNAEFIEVTGYKLFEVIGKNPRILQSGFHGKAFYKELWDTILAGKNWQGELYNRKKNGDLYWENANIVPIFNDHNEITHFVALKEDISEKKKMFEELIQAKKRAEESEKLKSAFLANMSHEIRTPLNSILGFTSFLTGNANLTEKEKELYSDIINKSAEGLLQIINDILDISRIETGQVSIIKKEFDINNTLEQIYKQSFIKHGKLKKSELSIRYQPHPSPLIIKQDEYKIIQILQNLVYNALKFTKEGMVQFGIEKCSEQRIHFFVSDTGIGIKTVNQQSIFERFRQIDDASTRSHGGNGLGLAIVKGLIDLLGGEIYLESEYGKGTTFRFWIPYE